MKLAVCSDLHLEVSGLEIRNTENADVLVLAGDILVANPLHDYPRLVKSYDADEIKKLGSQQMLALIFREFIQMCSAEFPHVIAIAGNHEFYHGRWSASISHLRQEYSQYPNVHFLERDIWKHDEVMFLGGTLWTDMNRGDPVTLHSIGDMMNDFNLIRNDEHGFTKLRPAHTVDRHRKTLDYFKKTLKENSDKKTVVISHHAPSHLSIASCYQNSNIMNGAYYTDLSEVILDHPQITTWIHGHCHNDSDYQIGDTRVVCHPRGYVRFERKSQEEDPYYPMIVDV